jgi:hypothetical protein
VHILDTAGRLGRGKKVLISVEHGGGVMLAKTRWKEALRVAAEFPASEQSHSFKVSPLPK